MLLSFLLSGFFYGIIAGFVAFFISPLQYIKITRQESSKSYLFIIRHAFASKKPTSVFFRGATPYVVMNFLSNMSFGFSDFICSIILSPGYLIITGVFVKAVLGGFFETIFTIYPEVKEIIRNKGDLAKSEGRLLDIVLPVTIRNTIAWVGAALAYEVSCKMDLSIFYSVLLSLVFGIVFGILSLPFDVITTQNCGSKNALTMMQRAIKIFYASKAMLLFGSVIRILQICIFTTTTVLTIFLLDI